METTTKKGRPAKEINYALVEQLAKICCTHEEIANVLEMTPEGFRKRCRRDRKLVEALERGRAIGKTSLRRKQYDTAMNGNVSMLIWLGKQMLGQAEKVEQDIDLNGQSTSPKDYPDETLLAVLAAGGKNATPPAS